MNARDMCKYVCEYACLQLAVKACYNIQLRLFLSTQLYALTIACNANTKNVKSVAKLTSAYGMQNQLKPPSSNSSLPVSLIQEDSAKVTNNIDDTKDEAFLAEHSQVRAILVARNIATGSQCSVTCSSKPTVSGVSHILEHVVHPINAANVLVRSSVDGKDEDAQDHHE
eukprot:9316-Heterococcus_DN1.PRE.2